MDNILADCCCPTIGCIPYRPVPSLRMVTMAVLPLCCFAFSDARLWTLTYLPIMSVVAISIFRTTTTTNFSNNNQISSPAPTYCYHRRVMWGGWCSSTIVVVIWEDNLTIVRPLKILVQSSTQVHAPPMHGTFRRQRTDISKTPIATKERELHLQVKGVQSGRDSIQLQMA